MCMCGKPTVNGETEAYSWDGKSFSTRQPNPPATRDDEQLIHDEPGRCGGLDAHSHHFRVVKWLSSYYLLVRHGGGDERFRLCVSAHLGLLPTLASLDSNSRYWLLHAVYGTVRGAACEARDDERAEWSKAAIEKRIKVRSRKGRKRVEIMNTVLERRA